MMLVLPMPILTNCHILHSYVADMIRELKVWCGAFPPPDATRASTGQMVIMLLVTKAFETFH